MESQASRILVSVCIPVFNGEAHLDPALDSVLNQTFTDIEVLAFDDGSTDGSWELLQSRKDPRLHCHRNSQNLGPEGNWNQALAAARGRYVKLFHQDDLLAPDCLARQVAAMETRPEVVLAFCRRKIVDARGRLLLSRGPGWSEGKVELATAARACALKGCNLLGEPSAVLLRTEVARAIGGFDSSIPYLVDLDYWLRMMRFGPAWYDDQPLASFRVSHRQWSARIGLNQGQEFARFLDRLADGPLRDHPILRGWGAVAGHLQGLMRTALYRML